MATAAKVLSRGTAAPTGTTYTVPASTTTVVTGIVICPGLSTGIYSISVNGTFLYSSIVITGSQTHSIDCKIVLTAGQTIQVQTTTTMYYHISGVEIT